jgi:hypothetical protein
MELAACYLFGALNFEIVARFLKNLYTLNLRFCVSSESILTRTSTWHISDVDLMTPQIEGVP